MSKIDEVLTQLLDGQWHNLHETAKALQIDCQKLQKVVAFLADFRLVTASLDRVQICYDTKNFLLSIREHSKEEEGLYEIKSSVFS